MSPKRRKVKRPRLIMLDVGQVFDLDERIAQLERLCDRCIDMLRHEEERYTLLSSELQRAERIAGHAESAAQLLGVQLGKRSAAARKANETRRAAAEADSADELPAELPAEGTSGD